MVCGRPLKSVVSEAIYKVSVDLWLLPLPLIAITYHTIQPYTTPYFTIPYHTTLQHTLFHRTKPYFSPPHPSIMQQLPPAVADGIITGHTVVTQAVPTTTRADGLRHNISWEAQSRSNVSL